MRLTAAVSLTLASCSAFQGRQPMLIPRTALGGGSSSSTSLGALQPEKGGIVVEAKSDFVARDVLLDAMMGRAGGGDTAVQESETLNIQGNDEADEMVSNEQIWDFSKKPKRGGQRAQQAQPRAQASAPRMPPPNQRTAKTARSAPPRRKTKSKLPDPSVMKLEDLKGELSLRQISFDDCVDRPSLENRLREGRAAMAAARDMERGSRRTLTIKNEQKRQGIKPRRMQMKRAPGSTAPSQPGGVGRREEIGRRATVGRQQPQQPNGGGGVQGSSTRYTTIQPDGDSFRSGTGTRYSSPQNPSQQKPGGGATLEQRANLRPNVKTNRVVGNPFSQKNKQAGRQGGGSSSSFRDNSRGIGFGDANSYNSDYGAGFGDGVRLGKKRTSYGEYNTGSSIGMGNAASAGGGSAAPVTPRPAASSPPRQSGGPARGANSFAGGSTSTFSVGGTGGGGGSSFSSGGVSIKGDSSIFSSTGFVGQGGSTSTFDMGGAMNASPPSYDIQRPANGRAAAAPQRRVNRPTAANVKVELDWLTQASVDEYDDEDDYGGDGEDYYAESSYSTPTPPPLFEDDEQDDEFCDADLGPCPPQNGERRTFLAETYESQGLDPLSGGRDGFGAVKGVESAAGDFSSRGSVSDVPKSVLLDEDEDDEDEEIFGPKVGLQPGGPSNSARNRASGFGISKGA